MLAACIVLSLLFHSALFWALPYRAASRLFPKRPIEVSYEQASPSRPNLSPSVYIPQQPEKSKLPRIDTAKIPKPFLEDIKKEILKAEPAPKEENAAFKKVVNLPAVPGEVAKSPEYKSYYQVIRERIRRMAYYNYKKLYEGEVFITFSISSQGELIDLAVVESKSTKSEYLRDIASESVRNAAPYPGFPEQLKSNKKLSFNVIISFELK